MPFVTWQQEDRPAGNIWQKKLHSLWWLHLDVTEQCYHGHWLRLDAYGVATRGGITQHGSKEGKTCEMND